MLRTALTYLLAVVLGLNGFLAPVAMAAHAAAKATAVPTASAACHGDGMTAATQPGHSPDQPSAPHDSSCCSTGHCVCGCLFSTAVAASASHASRLLPNELAAVAAALPHPCARYSVPLRPPIA